MDSVTHTCGRREAVDESGEQPEGQPNRLGMMAGSKRPRALPKRQSERNEEEKDRTNSENTLHIVLYLPSNATATPTATTAAATAATGAWSAAMRLQQPADMVIEKTTTGDVKLKETVTKEELLFYDINVNDFWMKPKFEKEYGCRHGPWCAGAAMWTPVVLSLFAVLALVCSLPNVTPSVFVSLVVVVSWTCCQLSSIRHE